MQLSRSRLARLAPAMPLLALALALALACACARPAPTAPEKTAVYETPLSPSAEPVDVEFESVTPRPIEEAPQTKEAESGTAEAEPKEPEAKSQSETKLPAESKP